MDASGQLDESLAALVALFGRVRQIDGPIFNDAIADWLSPPNDRFLAFGDAHQRALQGQPDDEASSQGRIKPEHFDRWLALWDEATAEMMAPAHAEAQQKRAASARASSSPFIIGPSLKRPRRVRETRHEPAALSHFARVR